MRRDFILGGTKIASLRPLCDASELVMTKQVLILVRPDSGLNLSALCRHRDVMIRFVRRCIPHLAKNRPKRCRRWLKCNVLLRHEVSRRNIPGPEVLLPTLLPPVEQLLVLHTCRQPRAQTVGPPAKSSRQPRSGRIQRSSWALDQFLRLLIRSEREQIMRYAKVQSSLGRSLPLALLRLLVAVGW